ncbi:hypothetical protein [Streptomyces mirabilis]|uniref:hypothetical protein n=1 Tax=Streptomyces mirabilis TaxID=68239 RepID=UPI0036AA0E0A
MKHTITIAGTVYNRVTDLRTLAPGDRIRQNHENHSTSTLTVIAPYGRHNHNEGVLCRLDARPGRAAYDTVLTDLSAEAGSVWLALTAQQAETHDVYGGDPSHPHEWTWTEDDGNGHMGFVCPCTAFRP